ERASESISQLKYALAKGEDGNGFNQSSVDEGRDNADRDKDDCGNAASQELQHSHAANQLKILLQHQARTENEISPSRRKKSFCKAPEAVPGDLPALSDLVPVINDQSQYINHLEAEVKFYKEEISEMKHREQAVLLENEELHQKLKFLTAEYTLREQTLLDASANTQNSQPVSGKDCSTHQPVTSSPAQKKDQAFVTAASEDRAIWHVELEKLKLLYQERVNVLDAQIHSLRKDLSEAQRTSKDLEGRLKHQKSLSARYSSQVGGLCLNCAQHEAVLAQTHCNVHVQTIERLTREKDDLMDALVSARQNIKELQKREVNACKQVEHAVQMAEEANFEKTTALVHYEQLKSEMERQKNSLEKELAAQLNKKADEKEVLRQEMKKEREDLAAMVKALSEAVAVLEAQVEKMKREKNSLVNQLEESQQQLASHEMEMNKVCGEMRYQLNQTKMKKDEAEKELREYRTKTIRELEIKDQKIEKLGLELNGNKQRLEQAQQDVTGAREECLKLTELLSKSEHQLHLTRLEKENIQQSISNEAMAQALQAQQREQELTQKMQQMEAQHEKTVEELDSLLTSQNTFIATLREECCALARKLEKMSEKYRSEVNQLSQEKEYLHGRLEKMQKQNDELDQQCIQHGTMHERMKSRLQQLDKHCQTTAQQLVELLNQQNQLLKEKHLLTEEVQFLRTQEKKRDADLKQDTDGIK
ncbi:SDCG8 protein, partial [Grantiella picta]|nr:SDCG8 protein [Grantiella picta]